jgi:hypothetical protein
VDDTTLEYDHWVEPEALDEYLTLEDITPGRILAVVVTDAQEVDL